jgi:hypothetical protein
MSSFSLYHWLIFLAIVYLIFRPLTSLFRPLTSLFRTSVPDQHKPPKKKNIPTAEFEWPYSGNFDFEIVGESYYQAALKNLVGDPDKHGTTGELTAHLIPEDQNPHDDKAVRVDINGYTVGYMSRDDARSFRRRLTNKKLTSKVTSCKAVILGGGIHTQTKQNLSYGVWLDLKPFE